MLDASSGPLEDFLEALRDVTFAAATSIFVLIVVIVPGGAAQEGAELGSRRLAEPSQKCLVLPIEILLLLWL